MRTASILEYLLQSYETDVICFRQPGAPSGALASSVGQATNLRQWSEIPLPANQRGTLHRGWRNAGRALRGVPPLVDRFAGFEDAVREALGGRRYEVVIVEHFWCATYAALLRPYGERLVLDLHNIESIWHRRCAAAVSPWLAPLHLAFARASARLEAELLPRFDLVLTTSQPDCHWITERFPGIDASSVANTIPLCERPVVEQRAGVVFSGNMEYLPNQQAVRHLASAIWPLLCRRHPGLQLKILGKGAANLKHFLAGVPRAVLVPDPDDAMMEIAQCQVAVVPLTMGTGTRLKIIEAWAAGCPVVSTSVGAEGLQYEDGVDILIRSSPGEFAAAVSDLLDSPENAQRLADAGRRRFEGSYSWARAWADLRNCGL